MEPNWDSGVAHLWQTTFVLRMEAGEAAGWKSRALLAGRLCSWGNQEERVAVEEILVGHVSGEEHEAMGELWRQ